MGVVDGLEVIDVEHHDAERVAAALDPGDLALQAIEILLCAPARPSKIDVSYSLRWSASSVSLMTAKRRTQSGPSCTRNPVLR